jgi:hypothetical protein
VWGGSKSVDPWYDYLALPVAPLVLLAQWAAAYVPQRAVRLTLSGAATASIGAMLVYLALLPISEEEGANIGAGVMSVWLIVSILLLRLAVARPEPAHGKPVHRRLVRLVNSWAKTAMVFSLFLIFVYPAWFLIPAPLIAIALSWFLEPASRLRLVATALAVASVVLVAVYHVVSGEWAQATGTAGLAFLGESLPH